MSETAENRRTKLEIITELHKLSGEMEKRRANAEFLVLSVEKRQALIAEYDKNRKEHESLPPSAEQMAEMKRLVKEIISMDASITKALEEHRNATKREIALLQQTRAGYLKQHMPQPGKRMDYKE
jgi:hypothetical protein